MFTPEDELDTLDEELGRERRRLLSLERAPHEGRWTRSGAEWMDECEQQRDRIARLEHDRAGLLADSIAAAEGFGS